ncbi:hypothetical protein MRX96_041548 [Rhipicephalus microplus]
MLRFASFTAAGRPQSTMCPAVQTSMSRYCVYHYTGSQPADKHGEWPPSAFRGAKKALTVATRAPTRVVACGHQGVIRALNMSVCGRRRGPGRGTPLSASV